MIIKEHTKSLFRSYRLSAALLGGTILLGLFARLYFASVYYGNYDQESYEIVVKIMLQGGNVYKETSRYNYSPIWSWILLALSFVPVPFHLAIRGFLSIADLGCAILISLIVKRSKPNLWLRAFILYWLNPVAILIVGYHGQFETLAMLPLLLSLYIRRANWLLATLSLLIKHITLPGIWVIFCFSASTKRKAILSMAASLAVFGASFLPYINEGYRGILQNVLLYHSTSRIFGFSSFVSPLIVYLLFGCIIFFLPWILKDRKVPIYQTMGTAFLSFIVFSPGMAQQYFLLPLLTAQSLPYWGYVIFSLSATLWILVNPSGLWLPIFDWLNWFWQLNLVWIVSAVWLFSFLAKTFGHVSDNNESDLNR